MEDLLNRTLQEILDEAEATYKKALVAIRKKQSEEEVREIWSMYFVDIKMQLEKLIWDTNLQHLKWIYAYLQNRNQSLTLHTQTRIGKQSQKKALDKATKIILKLLAKELEARNPCEICQKVDSHLLQLSQGRCDIVLGEPVFVKDYPDDYKYKEPAMVLAPQDNVFVKPD